MKMKIGRKQLAASSVELVCGLLMLVPVSLVLLDMGSILVSVFSNDSICREACRAASSADPKDAKKVAEQIVTRANSSGSTLAVYKLVEEPQKTSLRVPKEDQGGLIEGSVTLKTAVDVRPMFIVGAMYGGKPIEFVAQQTFPYTFVMQPKPKADKDKNNDQGDEEDLQE
jgi:hypothetical protein